MQPLVNVKIDAQEVHNLSLQILLSIGEVPIPTATAAALLTAIRLYTPRLTPPEEILAVQDGLGWLNMYFALPEVGGVAN